MRYVFSSSQEVLLGIHDICMVLRAITIAVGLVDYRGCIGSNFWRDLTWLFVVVEIVVQETIIILGMVQLVRAEGCVCNEGCLNVARWHCIIVCSRGVIRSAEIKQYWIEILRAIGSHISVVFVINFGIERLCPSVRMVCDSSQTEVVQFLEKTTVELEKIVVVGVKMWSDTEKCLAWWTWCLSICLANDVFVVLGKAATYVKISFRVPQDKADVTYVLPMLARCFCGLEYMVILWIKPRSILTMPSQWDELVVIKDMESGAWCRVQAVQEVCVLVP